MATIITTTLFWQFVILNFVNVLINTARSLTTVKGGKWIASLMNALCYGYYTVIIVITATYEMPLALKIVAVAIVNFVGVFAIKLGEEKITKEKLWIYNATAKVPNNELLKVIELLDNADIAKGTEGTIDDIRYANAGNSFLMEPWVRPWRNQNTQIGEDHKRSYSDVRGNDKIERVLQDEKFIQFTRQTFWKYMNLLMPEYERSVEVEDLNRNFWVIGQVLTLIYNFLFAPDNPISQIFDNMLDEICQLWENLLYLWAGFAIISQDLYERDIRVIVVPASNDDKYSYVKYDNFNVFATPHEAKLWEKVKYLKDVYNIMRLMKILATQKNKFFDSILL